MKNNVLYSIPCVAALLLIGSLTVLSSYPTYAVSVVGGSGAGGDIPINSAATATLSLTNPTMTSNAVVPGEVATTSTNVTVEVSNAESYSLTLSVDSANLTNGSTIIVPGNAITDNTWGYKWDNASTYTAPSTTSATLATPALTDNAVSFTKNLTFGAKFATNADAGTYHASGKLSLAATPKTIVNPFGIETMQEMTSSVCNNANIGDAAALIDSRDSNTYTIRKHEDSRCWMTQNLKLVGYTPTSTDSNVSSSSTYVIPNTDPGATLPTSWTTGYAPGGNYAWYSTAQNTAYYSWKAATAGTEPSTGEATADICPKGWQIPSGGNNLNSDIYTLFSRIGLTISSSLTTGQNSSTKWGDGDLAIVQGSTYGFIFTGYAGESKIMESNRGYWWTRTSNGSKFSPFALMMTAESLYAGTDSYYSMTQNGFSGCAIRCVAK